MVLFVHNLHNRKKFITGSFQLYSVFGVRQDDKPLSFYKIQCILQTEIDTLIKLNKKRKTFKTDTATVISFILLPDKNSFRQNVFFSKNDCSK